MKAHIKIHFDDSWKKAAFMERLYCTFFFLKTVIIYLKTQMMGLKSWGLAKTGFDWILREKKTNKLLHTFVCGIKGHFFALISRMHESMGKKHDGFPLSH